MGASPLIVFRDEEGTGVVGPGDDGRVGARVLRALSLDSLE